MTNELKCLKILPLLIVVLHCCKSFQLTVKRSKVLRIPLPNWDWVTINCYELNPIPFVSPFSEYLLFQSSQNRQIVCFIKEAILRLGTTFEEILGRTMTVCLPFNCQQFCGSLWRDRTCVWTQQRIPYSAQIHLELESEKQMEKHTNIFFFNQMWMNICTLNFFASNI